MQINELDLRDEILRRSGVNPIKCMKCGKCSATCPSYAKMDILPHRFVRSVSDGMIKPLMESETLWSCLSCFACNERCPRGVEPARLIEAVRVEVTRRQNRDYIKPDDIPEIVENDDGIPQQLIVSAFRKYSG